MVDQVQVYYWPTASIRSDCARASAANSYQNRPSNAANIATTTFASAGATDVVNGFT